MTSIVAIAAIRVLKAFMSLDTAVDTIKLAWLVGILLVFVVSTILIAWSDRLSKRDDRRSSG